MLSLSRIACSTDPTLTLPAVTRAGRLLRRSAETQAVHDWISSSAELTADALHAIAGVGAVFPALLPELRAAALRDYVADLLPRHGLAGVLLKMSLDRVDWSALVDVLA